MFDQLTQIFWGFLFIIVFFGFVFFLFICWKIREHLFVLFSSFGALLKTVFVALRKTVKDEYTRDEMIKNVAYFELRGETKTADFWRSEIARKYPEKPFGN